MDDFHPTALLYCHDSYGLGHIRRTLRLAGELGRRRPGLRQLLLTGSPLAHAFRLPDGVDYVKLPAVVKVGDDDYAPQVLPLPFEAARDLRRDLILSTATHARPDLLLVDNVPAGLRGELEPTLRHLRRTGATRLVLGLRDIVDDAARVRRAWTRDGVYELLDDVYDAILVYGDPDVYDPVEEYGFSARAAAKTRYVGYLAGDDPRRTPAQVRAEICRNGEPLVVATVGGGGDGARLLATFAQARRRWPDALDATVLLVAGPFLPHDDRRLLERELAGAESTHLVEFVEDLPSCLAAADAVVSMGGYNSVCEILSLGRPAVVVPRTEPRLEQLIRAEALGSRGLFGVLPPDELTPRRLLDRVRGALTMRPPAQADVDLDGLRRAGDELARFLTPDLAAVEA